MNKPLFRFLAVAVLFHVLLVVERAHAQHWNHDPATPGDWNVAGNWLQNFVPTAGSYTYVRNGGTAQLTTANGVTGFLNVGGGSTLEISGNGRLVANSGDGQALGGGGTGTLSISGPSASASLTSGLDYFSVGSGGNGIVNLSDGGTLTLNSGNGFMDMANSGSGTLNIGTGGAAGILNATGISVVNGTSTVNFNHTNAAYYFTKTGAVGGTGVAIGGTTQVFHLGSGLTALTAASTYTGGTTLNAGILSVVQDNNLGAATGTLTFNGGTLQTTGTFTMNRATTLTGNGTFATDAATTLTQQGVISGPGRLLKSGTGTLVLSGANTYEGGTTLGGGILSIADNGHLGAATGGLTFQGGTLLTTGTFTMNRAASLTGNGLFQTATSTTLTQQGAMGGAGALIKTGTGTLTLTGANTYAGGTTVKSGTLTVGTGGAIAHAGTELRVGDTNGDNGTLTINGGTVTNDTGIIAHATGSTGAVTVTGGTWTNNGSLYVGNFGNGTLTINGGYVSNTRGTIAYAGGTTSSVTVTGGTWANSEQLLIGGGTGSLLIDGGTVTSSFGRIAIGINSTGSVTVTSGSWTMGGLLAIGSRSTNAAGTLLVNGGTVSSGTGVMGDVATATGTATVSSGSWTTAGDITVGAVGTGTVNLTGGTISANAGAGTLQLGRDATATGTLNIGAGTTAGTLTAASVRGGSGSATVNFNHTGSLTFAPTLLANLSVNKLGAGTTILTGTNTYTGPTAINGGTLSISSNANLGAATGALNFNGGTLQTTGNFTMNRATMLNGTGTFHTDAGTVLTQQGVIGGSGDLVKTGAGQLTLTGTNANTGSTFVQAGNLAVDGTLDGAATVSSGATLSGTGTVSGLVTIANGGILAPGNSPGVLTVGALTLNNASILNYELGTPASDRIDVSGALTLDGILNVQAAVGFGEGTYRLINYGGPLTNQTLGFGLVPAPFEYAISTDTAGQVNLTVTAAALQYWDGAQTTPNGIVNGGTGTWDTTTTNWTTSSGNANSSWDGSVGAVFKGAAGTVTIANGAAINAPLLSFQVDGYILASTGTGQLDLTDTGTVEVFTGATATISAAIASGQLTKTQGGMLILSGANTYAGGTLHQAGTIQIANDDAFGTGTVTLDGGSLSTDGQDHYLENDFVIKANTAIALPTSGVFDQLELLGDVDLDGSIRTLTLSGDGGGLCLNGVISNGGLNLQSNGDEVSVMFCGTTNTYTGLTTVGANVTLELGATGTAVAGNLLIQEDGVVAVGGENQIADNVTVTVDGVLGFLGGSEQTINNLQGSGGITSAALPLDVVLTVNSGTFSGQIVDGPPSSIEVIKASAGNLTLSGVNTYSGGTSINAGTLTTNNASALGTGAVSLGSAGTLAITAGSTLDNVTGLDWANGGTFAFTLGSLTPATEFLTIDGTVAQSGTGAFVFADAGFLTNTTYDLITFDTAGSVLTNWTANMIGALEGSFAVRDNLDGTSTLTVTYSGAASGPVINNFAPDFTPTNANFQVAGQVTALPGAQQVRTLTFADGSTLTIMDTLSVNGGNFTVANGSATISGGALLTPGDFNKLGSGLLNVLSTIVTGGNTNIASGILAINGSLTTDNVLVQLGAWLKGSGLINGNVFNSGTVAPGNSPGTLTINGDFTQSASGTLQIEVADNAFDQLLVTGQASLAGTLQAVAFGGHQFAYGDQVAFLQAGSISGGFDNIVMSNPSQFRGRFLVNGGTGILLVAPTSYTLVAQNQNQTNVARALDSFIGASGDRDTVSLALDLQTENQYGNAFDQIAPGFYQTLTDTVIEQTTAQNQMLAQRLSAVRLGVGGFNVIGLDQAAIKNDRDGKNVMDARSDKDIISPATATKWSVFVQGNGIFSRVMNVSQVPNYRFNSGGFIVGADYTFGGESARPISTGGKSVVTTTRDSSLTLGLYTGYQGTYAKYANSSNMSINSALFGGYATYANGGFYSDLIVGGAYNGYRASRSIDFSTIDRTARSTPNGGSFTTYLDLGYDWKVGGFTFGPIVSGQYVYAGTSPFTENGADSLDLRVSQQNANSLRTNLGGRVAYTWQVADNITIIPEGRLFWQHEYLNGPSTIGASLDGGSGPGFDFQTSAPGRDSVFAGVGVSANFGDRWNTSVYYNADFGRQDYISHMISTSLSWKF